VTDGPEPICGSIQYDLRNASNQPRESKWLYGKTDPQSYPVDFSILRLGLNKDEHPSRCASGEKDRLHSRSPKNPALQQLEKSSKSASTTPQRPIWNYFVTVGVRDFSENGCRCRKHKGGRLEEVPSGRCHRPPASRPTLCVRRWVVLRRRHQLARIVGGAQYRSEPSQQPATPGRLSRGLPGARGPAIDGIWHPALSMPAPVVCPGHFCAVPHYCVLPRGCLTAPCRAAACGLLWSALDGGRGAERFLAAFAACAGVPVGGRLRVTVRVARAFERPPPVLLLRS